MLIPYVLRYSSFRYTFVDVVPSRSTEHIVLVARGKRSSGWHRSSCRPMQSPALVQCQLVRATFRLAPSGMFDMSAPVEQACVSYTVSNGASKERCKLLCKDNRLRLLLNIDELALDKVARIELASRSVVGELAFGELAGKHALHHCHRVQEVRHSDRFQALTLGSQRPSLTTRETGRNNMIINSGLSVMS